MNVLVGIVLSALAGAEGVQFLEGTWEQVLKEAGEKEKLVLVDFYTDWCGWCKVLERETFSKKDVGDYVSEHFVATRVDAEKGEGPDLAKRYGISGFPTVVVLDAKGEEVDRVIGFKPPAPFLDALKPIVAGKGFAALKRRVAEAPQDHEAALALGEKYQERRDYDAAESSFRKVLEAEGAPEKLRAQAEDKIAVLAFIKSRGQDIAPLEKLFEKRSETAPVADVAQMLFRVYRSKEDSSGVRRVGEHILAHGGRDDSSFLNEYAWYLVTHDLELKKALKLAQRAVELSPDAAHILDTLAECHFRLGSPEEAVVWQRKAVERAGESQRKTFEERLQKFEEGLKEKQRRGIRV